MNKHLVTRNCLLLICLVAFAIRLVCLIIFPGLHHPDENFQLFEQAHRFAFGYGIVPWEFTDGLRSPVVPFLLSLIFRVGDYIFGNSYSYILLSRVIIVEVSVIPIILIFFMGLRRGLPFAIMGSVATATWFELVYFSFRPLTEALATHSLLCSLALLSYRKSPIMSASTFFVGFCAALTMMLRIQFAPVCFFIIIYSFTTTQWTDFKYFVFGFIIPVSTFGFADLFYWGYFFHSYFTSLEVNYIRDKASEFGVSEYDWYFRNYIAMFGTVFPWLILLIAADIRRNFILLIAAATILIAHSAIPHKEYRFTFAASSILFIVSALSSVHVLYRYEVKYFNINPTIKTLVLAFMWSLTSMFAATSSDFVHLWGRRVKYVDAMFFLSAQHDICGVLLNGVSWGDTGGYAFLHQNVPLYEEENSVLGNKIPADAYNYVLTEETFVEFVESNYSQKRCFSRYSSSPVCVLRRRGECKRPAGELDLLNKMRLGDPGARR